MNASPPLRAARTVLNTVAVFGLCLAAVVLAGKAVVTLGASDGSTSIDANVLDGMVDHRSAAITTVAKLVTLLGGFLYISLVTVVLTVVLLVAHHRRLAAYLVTVVIGASLLSNLGKAFVGRARPPLETRLASVGASAFPSGHATQAAATYVALAVIAHVLVANPRVRLVVWLTTGVVIAGVAISRVYLGVHWFTDVVAGCVLGVSWALGVARAFSPLGGQPRGSQAQPVGRPG